MIKSIEEERQSWVQMALKASHGTEGRSDQREREAAQKWSPRVLERGGSFLKPTYIFSPARCIHIHGEMALEETQTCAGVGVMVSVLVFCSGSLIANQALLTSKISIFSKTVPGHLQFSEIML